MLILKALNPTLTRILSQVGHRDWLTLGQQRVMDRLMTQADRVWWGSLTDDLIFVALYGESKGRSRGMVIPQNGVDVYLELVLPEGIEAWLNRFHDMLEGNQS